MKKYLVILMATVFLIVASVVNAETFKERLAKKTYQGPVRIVHLFIDTNDNYTMMEQKVFDNFADKLKQTLPAGCTLVASNQFVSQVDLYREDKLEKIVSKNPEAFAMASVAPTIARIILTRDDWKEICKSANTDYVMYIRIEKGAEKVKTNALAFITGIGGLTTQVEMNITTRLFNANKGEYTFTDRQRVTGKVHGQFAPDTAAKRALPKIIPNLKLTEAAFSLN